VTIPRAVAESLIGLADSMLTRTRQPASVQTLRDALAAPQAQPTEAMVEAAIAAHDAAMGRRRDEHRVSKAQMPSVAEFKQWQREAFAAALREALATQAKPEAPKAP
jgi:hypothetical protein